MNTGYYSFGALIMNRKLILRTYLKTWFIIDLAASFPLTWIIDGPFVENEDDESGSSALMAPRLLRLFKILRFLRILKLLRIAKLTRILVNFEDVLSSNSMSNLFVFLRLLTGVFFLAHWTACMWAYLAGKDNTDNYRTWRTNAYIADRSDAFDQYVAALYWAFTTMTTTGYGDIIPITLSEKIFTMFTMLLACGVFAFTLGSVSSLITKQGQEEAAYRISVTRLGQYMKKKGVPTELQFKVRRYMEYVWDVSKESFSQEHELIDLLSEPLKEEVYSHLHTRAIRMCPVFDMFQPEFSTGLTKLIATKTFAPYDVIFEEGSFSRCIFFIKSGEVQIYHKATNSIFIVFRPGQCFGEVGFFGNIYRTASVKCLDFTMLMYLDKFNFDKEAEMYPEVFAQTLQLEKHCRKIDLMPLGIKCFVCKNGGHVAIQCRKTAIHQKKEETKVKWLNSKLPQTKYVRINDPLPKRKSKKDYYNRFGYLNVKGKTAESINFNSASILSAKVKDFIHNAATECSPSEEQINACQTNQSQDFNDLVRSFDEEAFFTRLPQIDISDRIPCPEVELTEDSSLIGDNVL
mmetsp:Transcript_14216/g.26825  ORF Transcript_14216/g.26825 Transcript_14216/m.26825 type:complete len:575 (-) Transcript_14216:76-1800(-)